MKRSAKERPPIWILALDVERLGQNPVIHSTIQVGASVVDQSGNVLETYRYSEYRSEPEYASQFSSEERCMTEFWSKFPDQLKAIEKDTNKMITVEQGRAEMISGFVNFVKKWEQSAENNKTLLYITMYNKICDAWTINTLITTYLPNDHPVLPYSFYHKNKYLKMYESISMMNGMMMGKFGLDPFDGEKRNCESTFFDLFNVDKSKIQQHTHFADEDATECAQHVATCIAISRGIHSNNQSKENDKTEDEVIY